MKAAVVSVEFADSVNARKLKTYQDTKKLALRGLFCVLLLITTFPKIRYFFRRVKQKLRLRHKRYSGITLEPKCLIIDLSLRDSGFLYNLAYRVLYRYSFGKEVALEQVRDSIIANRRNFF